MTQDYNHRPSRRAARAGRKRPELVTSTPMEEMKDDSFTADDSPTLEESQQKLEATAATPRKRKLANFFSTVGRSDKTSEAQENEVAQARLARATGSKGSSAAKNDSNSEVKEDKATAKASTPTRTTPARRSTSFKTKYLLGFAIYLFGANFLSIFERQYMIANHLEDPNHPAFHLGPLAFGPFEVVYLATLILLLILLARLDLIPRSLGALTGQQPTQQGKRSTSNDQNTAESARTQQPTVRQGVKGADDDLYQEYRANQRRTRKR
jgi:hypothetical protein